MTPELEALLPVLQAGRARAARRRARPAAALAPAVAALVVIATAVAAGGGWLFRPHDRAVTAVTHAALGGRSWRVSLLVRRGPLLRLCLRASTAGRPAVAAGCSGVSPRPLGPPFGARVVDVGGGQIWAGATVGFTRRVSITDAAGHVHSAPAVRAPQGTRTPFRYWVLALDGTTAASITAYDARGRSITRRIR